MAYTFPMPITDFFDNMPITVSTFDLGESLEYNKTGAGEALTADLSERLWKMDCELVPDYHHEMDGARALLDVLGYAGRSLIAYPPYYYGPKEDKDGAILGASSVTLTAVASNRRDITLSGLPAGYVLSRGDYFGYQYGSNPVRYAFHRLARGGTANGSGAAIGLESSSFIQPGYALPAAVKLIKPQLKMVLVPGSVDSGSSRSRITAGVKFSLVQTFR